MIYTNSGNTNTQILQYMF